jgi:predicted metal-dependent HD superfamily phosphohydrolase
VTERWWQVLVAHYGFGGAGSARSYHCLSHVSALLDLCAAHASALQRRDLVELAIFFHECAQRPDTLRGVRAGTRPHARTQLTSLGSRHDGDGECSVIYDAKAKDNEEQSARLFEQYADEVGLVTNYWLCVPSLSLALHADVRPLCALLSALRTER